MYRATLWSASLAGNPAGLGFVEGLEADFLHDGYYDSGHVNANALYLTGGTGPFALGGGFDWQYGPYSTVRRASLGAALRFGAVSFGAVHRGFNSRDVAEAWDYGALARPFRWLSLGGAVLYANRPGVPRLWRLAAGIRPFGEKVDLAADFRWRECTGSIGISHCGTDQGDYIFTAAAAITQGVRVLGQLTAPVGEGSPSWLVGLQLDLPHAGFSYEDWPFSSSPPANGPKSSPLSFLQSIHCLVVIASGAWQSLTSGLLRGLTPRNDRICAPTGPAFRSEALEGPLIRSFALEHSPTPNAVCP